MIGWLVLVVYVIGFAYTARRVAIAQLVTEEKFNQSLGYSDLDTEDRVSAAFAGVLLGLMWPLILPGMWFVRSLRTPDEIVAEQRAELEALRKQAREYGLPMPEVSDQ